MRMDDPAGPEHQLTQKAREFRQSNHGVTGEVPIKMLSVNGQLDFDCIDELMADFTRSILAEYKLHAEKWAEACAHYGLPNTATVAELFTACQESYESSEN
jgi:hypothetical protein